MKNRTGSAPAVVIGALAALLVCHLFTGFTLYDRRHGVTHRQAGLIAVAAIGAGAGFAGTRLLTDRRRERE